MKKFLALLLCMAIVLTLAACGGGTATGGDGDSEQSGGTTDTSGSSEGTQSNTQSASAYDNLKAIFPNKTFTDEVGSAADSKTHIVTDTETGVQWRYLTVDANKKGETVNVLQISDFHVVAINDRDRQNDVTMNVFSEHSGNKEGMGTANLDNILQYPQFFDFTVGTGDNMDYLTYGGLELLKSKLFSLPNSLFALGNHDIARTNSNSKSDPTTLDNRYEQLKQYWPHDVDYASAVIKDTVMVIQLDNSQSKYYGEQATKLAADIEKARQQNLTVLIFQHMPIAVNDAGQSRVDPIRDATGSGTLNFHKSYIGGSKYVSDDVTTQVYNLITQNADVVRGVFCGHQHADYYAEIHGSYTKDGTVTEAVIPQYVMANNFGEKGHAVAITVK